LAYERAAGSLRGVEQDLTALARERSFRIFRASRNGEEALREFIKLPRSNE
jgi:hypothetical protein